MPKSFDLQDPTGSGLYNLYNLSDFSFTLLESHWPPCFPWTVGMFLSQGPCIFCPFFLEKSLPYNLFSMSFSPYLKGFPGGTVIKNLPAIAGESRDMGSISGSGRSPGGGNGNPLQHSWLEISMDRRAWQATVHGVSKESDMIWQLNHKIIMRWLLKVQNSVANRASKADRF